MSADRKVLNWEDVEKRLASYGAMAVAVAVAGVSPAEAGIIYTNPLDATTPVNGIVAFNLETGTVSTASSAGMHFVLRNSFSSFSIGSSSFLTYRSAFVSQGPVGSGAIEFSGSFPAKLGLGSPIDAGGSFGSFGTLVSSFGSGNFGPSQQGYLGLRFLIGANTHYGWANITVNNDLTVTLADFAFEACADEGIAAGATSGGASCAAAVPEPHSAVLLALGAAGLLAFRRRRKAA